jgi:uncharacterized RDD family membrane protein YckC
VIRHEVVSTERVPFRYRVAGMGSRFLAWLFDCCVWGALALMGAVLASVLDQGREGLGTAAMLLWIFLLRWGYFLVLEWLWQGQTPGKRMLGIRVIRLDGTAVSFAQSTVRNIVRVIDALPMFYGLGFVIAAANRAHRRLGDLAAGTIVVHVERSGAPLRPVPQALAEMDRERLALLRQRLGQLDRAQKQTLVDLCLRREHLGIAERARLFATVADYVRQRLGLAPEAFESDEKFVQRLTAILGG